MSHDASLLNNISREDGSIYDFDLDLEIDNNEMTRVLNVKPLIMTNECEAGNIFTPVLGDSVS